MTEKKETSVVKIGTSYYLLLSEKLRDDSRFYFDLDKDRFHIEIKKDGLWLERIREEK